VQAFQTAVSYDLPDAVILSSGCEPLLAQLRAPNRAILPPAVKQSQWERHSIIVGDVPVEGPDGIQVLRMATLVCPLCCVVHPCFICSGLA
jgi:hypothetical protein